MFPTNPLTKGFSTNFHNPFSHTPMYGHVLTHLEYHSAITIIVTLRVEKSALHLSLQVWLVVWLPFFIFPYIGFLIIPTDFHIFQRGGPTTNQRSLFSAWFFWTRFQRHKTRSHASFVRLLRAQRSHRGLVLLQAALASWQQFTLRILGAQGRDGAPGWNIIMMYICNTYIYIYIHLFYHTGYI